MIRQAVFDYLDKQLGARVKLHPAWLNVIIVDRLHYIFVDPRFQISGICGHDFNSSDPDSFKLLDEWLRRFEC